MTLQERHDILDRARKTLKAGGHHGQYHDITALIDDLIEVQEKAQTIPVDAVRVRIAVAVDDSNRVFTEAVCRGVNDSQARDDVGVDCDGAPIAEAFIEADIPRIPVVRGRVVETNL